MGLSLKVKDMLSTPFFAGAVQIFEPPECLVLRLNPAHDGGKIQKETWQEAAASEMDWPDPVH